MLDWFYANVEVAPRNSYGVLCTKRVPRVRFYYGNDYAYDDMRTLALYWSPRTPCNEGEEVYKHYITFKWRLLFHFYWR